MQIGELAARTGVSVRSLRYYEEQGLLTSSRSPGGHRRFTDDDVKRVGYVQRLYTAGLSSRAIVALLPCAESPSTENTQAAFRQLMDERDRLATHIANLKETLDSLNELIALNRSSAAT